MTLSHTPSEWFINHFEDHSVAVMKALVAAGRSAHERSLEAKAGSRLKTNDAYGATFWLSLPQELVAHLAFLPAAELLHPHRSRYDLIVFRDTVVLPVKMGADSTGPDNIKLRPSAVRQRLFRLEKRESAMQTLDFEEFDLGQDSAATDFGSASSLALVAFDCTARGGLQHIYVGDALMMTDGAVIWTYKEELPLAALTGDTSSLTLISDRPAPRFDDATPPAPVLELRTPGDGNEVEEVADPSNPEAATGTGNDDHI